MMPRWVAVLTAALLVFIVLMGTWSKSDAALQRQRIDACSKRGGALVYGVDRKEKCVIAVAQEAGDL
jgi:hypothetical protein